MCRVLAYLGEPVVLDDLLYRPDSSLVTQSHSPRMLQMLNLAGFGLLAWDETSFQPRQPFAYRSTALPMFDPNLKSLATKLRARSLLAHVRGVPYHSKVSIGDHNLHPFRFDESPWALAHNGDLYRFPEMKFDLLEHIEPRLAQKIRGNTDSEWMYALTLSQLEDPLGDATPEQMGRAVAKMLAIVRKCRERLGIDISSPANLFLANGRGLVAARFTFDYGCYPTDEPSRVHEMQLRYLSLWYTAGTDYGFHDGEWKMRGGMKNAKSVMVASEPLTKDPTTWMEVPEYGLIHLEADGRLGSFEIDA